MKGAERDAWLEASPKHAVAFAQAEYAWQQNTNATDASTMNLRGLGSDATLVLLNGHRLSADSGFQGSDVSGIPLSAVERIEVVPDGASALYGADAVAGVVNMVLRRNYDGAEASVRVGGASQGGGIERTYSAVGGVSRADWHVLANFEHPKQDEITEGDRDFTASTVPGNFLLQPQTRDSFFVSAGRDLTERAKIGFDGLLSERDARNVFQYSSSGPKFFTKVRSPAYWVSS